MPLTMPLGGRSLFLVGTPGLQMPDKSQPPADDQLPLLPPSPTPRLPQGYQPAPIDPDSMGRMVGLPPGVVNAPNAIDHSTDFGRASYGGPRLNTESALAGLKGSGSLANSANLGGLLPESELYRLASRDSNSVAPGANQYWQSVLGGRQAQSNALNPIKDIANTNSAMQELHPGVQQSAENEAQRRSYPAQYQAQGVKGAAHEAGQADIIKQQLVNTLGLSAQEAQILEGILALRKGTTGVATKDEADKNLEQTLDPAILAGLRNRGYIQ